MSLETAFFGIFGDAAAPLLLDAATIAHLAAMAVGLGSAVFADWTSSVVSPCRCRRTSWRWYGGRTA